MIVSLSTVRFSARKMLSGMLMALLLSGTFAAATVAGPTATYAEHSQCSDGIDNDTNGRIDYPQDTGCESLDDNYEGVSAAGVFISITDDKDKVGPGGNVVYAITINQQRDESKLVTIDMHLPVQSNVVSASDGGSVSNGMVRWTNVSVYKNSPRRLTVNSNVFPDATPGQYLVARANIVGVSGAEATDTTLVDTNANLGIPLDSRFSVTLSDGVEFILPGTTLHYIAKVRNDGNVPVETDVRVTMPEQTEYIDSDQGSTHDLHNVVWKKVKLDPGEVKTFNFAVRLEQRVPDRTLLRARVTVGSATALDQTSVRVGVPDGAISANLTDNKATARVGDLLTYVIHVQNSSNVIASEVSVNASLPLYSEFVSATEGGRWDGTNVRWQLLPIAPNGDRYISYVIRVRSDAPMGATLVASSSADGFMSRDSTLVSDTSTSQTTTTTNTERFVFRKTTDTGEVAAGGTIRYTLFVRNNLDFPITDAVISDRFDGEWMTIDSVENGSDIISRSSGKIDWRVPVLQPGQSWQTSYVLSVSANLPQGSQLERTLPPSRVTTSTPSR